MADLTTSYLGLQLSSPVVASASPLTGELDTARRIADAGAAALVMPSLFEEEILQEEVELNRALEAGSEHFAEALDYFPSLPDIANPADRYLTRLAQLKAALDIPVIASLNATAPGSWARYAMMLVNEGADAIELNLYAVAADPHWSAADVEGEYVEAVAEVRAATRVPLAVKLSPFFSSTAHFAHRVVDAGADGLVLFNRFYQPDIDLETLDVVSRVELSAPWELRLPLRWIAILRPLLPQTGLAATTGIATGDDAAKALAVGADVAMATSALLRHGPARIGVIRDDLDRWLDEHGYASADELRGSMSHATTDNPAGFERANYRKMLHSWTTPTPLTPSAPGT